jgi:cysteine dioxygenase
LNSNDPNPVCQSLNELITALSEGERKDYNQIIRSMKFQIGAFEDHCSWCEKSYTRNCIIANEKFEMILLCWEKGQVTPIHDHGGEECWVKVIDGELGETIYKEDKTDKLSKIKSTISKTGDVSYMIDFMGFHRLENLSNTRSISLHIYAKPIRNCNIFNEDSSKFIRKDLVYSTISEMMTNL